MSATLQSPPTVPRIQSLLNSFRLVNDPIPVFEESLQKYGDTYALYLGGLNKGIITTNPDLIQQVLQKHHRKYAKSEIQTKALARYLGRGLLTSDGPYWLRQRRLIQPGFHREKLAALVDIMNEEVDQFIARMDSFAAKGEVFDVYPLMMELAFRIVIKALFSTNASEDDLRSLSENITVIQEFLIRQIRQPFLNPWYRLSGKERKYLQLAKNSKAIIMRIIKDRKKSGTEVDDLLGMLLSSRYEDTGEAMTDKQILEECLILFVAGHETSANALSWAFYLLSQHPEVTSQLRAEVETHLGNRTPRFADLRNLPYITQCIEETMRLYPPAWITDRIAVEDDETSTWTIPKGTMVVPFIYGVHRDEKYWEDPSVFRPDRFTKEAVKKRHPFSYLPFGGGPRLCIGNNFAMMEMQIVLSRMMRRFDFELVPGQLITPLPLVTLRPRYGIKMTVQRR